MKTDTTKVIFRKWRDTGDVIAFFPAIASDRDGYFCQSYMHVGQHSSADYTACVRNTHPASPSEYASLKRELESAPFGYVFEVASRETAKDRELRKQSASV